MFITVAHVTEDWIVDANGNFIETHHNNCSEVVAKPNSENTWQCLLCGAEAKVIDN